MNDIAAAVQLSDLADLDASAAQAQEERGQPEVTARGSRRFELLEKNIRRLTGRAIADFDMIRDGDVIMACMSGGADSYTMLETLRYLQTVAPVKFEIIAVNLDQKQPGFPEHILPEYFERIGVPYRIVEEDTYSIVKEKIAPGKTTCSLCSRLRRGILYRVAKELGATKIALGHHRDDILHTFMLNMFYGGKIKTMPPKLIADDGENVVIRPLAYVREPDIKKYAAAMEFPIIPCNLCGSQPNLQRQAMREMLNQWEKTNPLWIKSMFTAMANITPSHMLDRSLFDFTHFTAGAGKEAQGDTLFDRDDKLDQGQSVINLV
ncbi:tRNA 2-thiocytidine(32) synthetase TtcA [Herbaspirillum huttiense]|jgi:tRNA s(2)C-32 sulfurtransferase (EC 2.8.1.4)|uniref:tRNA 2-thiocytidine(32) synthetase TtcA n=1 Tax=Herbaspirillum huttiense TaxID=863372 RepID=UPI000F262D6F|nr:tRNA 2-thiocytidine(32) synthetase TtcA [Herbaspirillum huttiense]UWE16132.1 tRNA 2-thiocytidine(32) synthetase TtcA [Herbaspirillum huttiense]